MERGETIFNRMTVVVPLQLEQGFKALRFEVGSSRSLSLRSIKHHRVNEASSNCFV